MILNCSLIKPHESRNCGSLLLKKDNIYTRNKCLVNTVIGFFIVLCATVITSLQASSILE